MISKKHQKVCKTLNYIEQFLILASAITGCVSVSAFASSVDIPTGMTSSAIGLKFFAITAGKFKSIIKIKKKKHVKIVLLAKPKLSRIEVANSKSLIDLVIGHHKFVLINNVLKEYN